jgi:acyl carrier protein
MTTVLPQTIRERVRAFIAENFYVPDMAALADDGSLVELGIVDSTGILEVIAFLESTFEIQIEDAEAVPANLDSIRNIVAFVGRKLEPRPMETAA